MASFLLARPATFHFSARPRLQQQQRRDVLLTTFWDNYDFGHKGRFTKNRTGQFYNNNNNNNNNNLPNWSTTAHCPSSIAPSSILLIVLLFWCLRFLSDLQRLP
ncbi:hypothetical protein PIB30_044738 [Stylosanthes scabra]|uniref:Uncharacterized protein n=1 Tax=Stylosanthes scabra TaxID=79078 RepID=A0ABU6YES7_9FABA|nr:hypothetical protein [Stylosanthes scabra]